MLLTDRTALITGGADGIGLAVAARFAAQGATVVLADVRETQLEAAVAGLQTAGARASGVVADVTDAAASEAMVATCLERHGALDVAVANAGILRLAPVLDLTPEDFRAVVEVNLTGAFLTLRSAAAAMRAAGRGGRIIVSSSLFGLRGGATNAAYAATKFGVLGLVESAAADLAADGILVNAVCPGQIDTTMLRDTLAQRAAARGIAPEQVMAEFSARIPMARPGAVEEVADVFVYLASELSRYVTGREHVVDGGWMVG